MILIGAGAEEAFYKRDCLNITCRFQSSFCGRMISGKQITRVCRWNNTRKNRRYVTWIGKKKFMCNCRRPFFSLYNFVVCKRASKTFHCRPPCIAYISISRRCTCKLLKPGSVPPQLIYLPYVGYTGTRDPPLLSTTTLDDF